MNYPKNASEATTQIANLLSQAQTLKAAGKSAYVQLGDAMQLADNFSLPLVVPADLQALHDEIREEWEGSSEWNSSGC